MAETPTLPTPRTRRTKPIPPSMPDTPSDNAPELALYAALLRAQQTLPPLVKDSRNDYLKSDYLSLPSLLAAVRGPLAAEGLLITTAIELAGSGFVARTSLVHAPSGARLSSVFPVPDPMNPQRVAAAATYAVRISLMQLLGVAAEDHDGQEAPAAPAAPAWQPPAAPAATRPAPWARPELAPLEDDGIPF